MSLPALLLAGKLRLGDSLSLPGTHTLASGHFSIPMVHHTTRSKASLVHRPWAASWGCGLQGISGTGSLMVGAQFLRRHHPVKTLLLSSPTWSNHHSIFGDAGFKIQAYRYYSPATHMLDFEVL